MVRQGEIERWVERDGRGGQREGEGVKEIL